MTIAGSRVGVVGGSIAGCAMALGASRLGCDVTVFEASGGALADRGVGIFVPMPFLEELADRGYLPNGAPHCHPPKRFWLVADPGDPAGRVIWHHRFAGAANNWGVLWHGLRRLVPDTAYRRRTPIRACEPAGDEVALILDDGSRERFDVVVGADGYCSTLRDALFPDVRPTYAGYVLWRGSYDEGLLPTSAAGALLEDGFATICFPGGHAVVYLIPGQGGGTEPGQRRVNWAIYGVPPAGVDFKDPTSIPPGGVSGPLTSRLEEILAEHIPPVWADLVRVGGSGAVFVQPIYDHAVPRYVTGRIVLAGDAAALSRPHTGSGASKALQDALAFEDAGRSHASWPEASPPTTPIAARPAPASSRAAVTSDGGWWSGPPTGPP